MRLALLSDDFRLQERGGGSDAILFSLAKSLAARGHDVLIVTTTHDAGRVGTGAYEGVAVHSIAAKRLSLLRHYAGITNLEVVREVKRVLADFRPDVVNAHTLERFLSYGSLYAAKQLGMPVVLTCHDVQAFHRGKLTTLLRPDVLEVPEAYDYRSPMLRRMWQSRLRTNPIRAGSVRRAIAACVTRAVSVSCALKNALEQNGIGNVEVIHNGIDATAWDISQESVERWKRAHGIGDAMILYGGRISRAKGSEKIVEALVQTVARSPTAQLCVVGRQSPGLEAMLANAKSLGVAERIVPMGWISGDDLKCAYHAAALVAVPSICFDPFPTMNLEAMACGKPVIATCVGGSREIVEDGITGYIVNPMDVATLAAKITELLNDNDLAARMGRAGREKLLRGYDVASFAGHYETLFHKCATPTTCTTPVAQAG